MWRTQTQVVRTVKRRPGRVWSCDAHTDLDKTGSILIECHINSHSHVKKKNDTDASVWTLLTKWRCLFQLGVGATLTERDGLEEPHLNPNVFKCWLKRPEIWFCLRTSTLNLTTDLTWGLKSEPREEKQTSLAQSDYVWKIYKRSSWSLVTNWSALSTLDSFPFQEWHWIQSMSFFVLFFLFTGWPKRDKV